MIRIKRIGFTLVEFLIAIFIILVLGALFYPAIRETQQKVHGAATRKALSQEVFDPRDTSGLVKHYYRVLVVDNCEYIAFDEGMIGQCMTHKGNCKFCYQRNR